MSFSQPIDPTPAGRLVDLWTQRAREPRVVKQAGSTVLGDEDADTVLYALSDRERAIVARVFLTVAAELAHALEEGRQSSIVARVQGHEEQLHGLRPARVYKVAG